MKTQDLNSQRFVLDTQANVSLRNRIKDDPQASLKAAAQEFESMMLQMLMKSMRDATPQDSLMGSDQTRFYTTILDQQMAQNLSGKGSLGFARMIEAQLGRQSATTALPTETNASLDALQQSLLRYQSLHSQGAERIRTSTTSAVSGETATDDASSRREFVNRLWPHAVEAANSIGVPAQFLIAHAALETGWGKSEIRTATGQNSHNLFGIKAGRSWNGASVEVPTTEYINGEAQSVNDKFRVYGSYSEAFRDYANLLKNSSRFSAVQGQQDGTQFARTLQQGGYATDPSYADKLGRIINGATLRQALSG